MVIRTFPVPVLVTIMFPCVAACSTSTPESKPVQPTYEPRPYVEVIRLNEDRKTLKAVEFRGHEVDIDISGLNIDINCANDYNFSPGEVRIGLLRTGCAEVIPGVANVSDTEARKEQEAQSRPSVAVGSRHPATGLQ